MRRFPSGGAGGVAARLGADNLARQALSESPDENRQDSSGRLSARGRSTEPKETASQIEDEADEGDGMMGRLDRMEERQKRIEDLLVQLSKGLQGQQDTSSS